MKEKNPAPTHRQITGGHIDRNSPTEIKSDRLALPGRRNER